MNNNKCSAKEIDEKRRQALEKLKARQSQQVKLNNAFTKQSPAAQNSAPTVSVNFEIASESRFEAHLFGFSDSLVSYFR
jgi:hypothetical protein